MGLFTFLKNGLTIEKKKQVDVVDEVAEEPAVNELLTEPEVIPTPIPTPAPVVEETPTDKKKLAEYILYGTNNPDPTPAIEKPQPAAAAPVQQTYNAYNNVSANFNSTLMGPTTVNQNLLVISPKSADEISAILSNLASGNACIVSLANISDAQRHLDYICGFMNAIGGTIMQRTQTEYILTPKGVGIKS